MALQAILCCQTASLSCKMRKIHLADCLAPSQYQIDLELPDNTMPETSSLSRNMPVWQ